MKKVVFLFGRSKNSIYLCNVKMKRQAFFEILTILKTYTADAVAVHNTAKFFNFLICCIMANLTSDNFKIVGFETEVNGMNVRVINYLTAKQQFEAGLVSKTEGTQVVYTLAIDGKETTMKGKQFSNWCVANGIEVNGKSGEKGRDWRTKLANVLNETKGVDLKLAKLLLQAIEAYDKAEAKAKQDAEDAELERRYAEMQKRKKAEAEAQKPKAKGKK